MKNILWVSLLFLSTINSLNGQILDLSDPESLNSNLEFKKQGNSIIITKGDLIKINDHKRQYLFHEYDEENQILMVKDIKQKLLFTQHEKIDFKLEEIDKILIRTDDYNSTAALLWYPTTLFVAAQRGIGLGLVMAPLTILGENMFQSVAMAFVSFATFDSMYQAWPLAKKIGKGSWLTIDFNSDDPWELKATH
jgi:hypothetical protein